MTVSRFRNEYRIVRWLGPATGRLWHVPQVRRWWFPLWIGGCATTTICDNHDEAVAWCANHASPPPKKAPPSPIYLGRLP